MIRKAEKKLSRVKVLIYGSHGLYKTRTALHFPRPAMIDLEQGAEIYGDELPFGIVQPKSVAEITDAIDDIVNSKEYDTIILDSATVLWLKIQQFWNEIYLSRNQRSKGFKFEFYEFQPLDWRGPKDQFKSILEKLRNTGLHVVITAREKAEYADGEFMKKIGVMPDAEKTIAHEFDTVIHVAREGGAIATVEKDRTNSLPPAFDITDFSNFQQAFDLKPMESPETAVETPPVEITAQTFNTLALALEMMDLTVQQRIHLLKEYQVDTIENLTEDQAQQIIARIEKKQQEVTT